MEIQPEYLRPEQVAVVLQRSRKFVYRLIASGKLRSSKLGNARLIPREAVAEMLREAGEES